MFVDQVTRISLRQLNARFPRRRWLAMTSVSLQVPGSETMQVEIVKTSAPLCFGGYRRWLRCPGCARLAQTVAFNDARGWGCLACLRWRSRKAGQFAE